MKSVRLRTLFGALTVMALLFAPGSARSAIQEEGEAPSLNRRSQVRFDRTTRGVEVILSKAEDQTACEGDPTFGRVAIGNRRSLLILLTPNICEKESWRRIICRWGTCRRAPCQKEGCGNLSGIPGFGVFTWIWHEKNTWHQTGTAGSRVNIEMNGDNATQEYRVVARTKDRRRVGWLTINRQRFWSWQRIYEGTDAFVNYCIDDNREIRSLNGRLYCWRKTPIRGPSHVAFHRHRQRR